MTMQVSTNGSPVLTEADSRLWADVMQLVPVLHAGRDELAEAMTDRFLAEVAQHHHDLPHREETFRAYGAHLDAVLHAADLPIGEQARAISSAAAAHGRAGGAADVPLAIQVEFYRLGLRALSEALLRESGDGAAREGVTDAVATVWRLQDTWVQSMTSAYYRQSREAIRWREQRRSSLVGAVLDGDVTDAAELWDVADALWLPHDNRYVVVALEVAGDGQEKVRIVENRLSRAGIPSAWRLLPAGQTVVTGVAAVAGGAGERQLTEVLSQTWEHRAGISPQLNTLGDAARAVRFAKVALGGAPRGSGRVTVFDEAPVAVVAASAPDVLAEVARTVLGTLNQLPADDREVLIGTVRTWFMCGGSTEATAKALFCHPNTVRYRLNRVTEHTARSLTDPLAVAELALALQGDLLARCG